MTLATHIMTPDPVTVEGNSAPDRALQLMDAHGVRHLPVTDGEQRITGMLTDRELLAHTGGLPSRVHDCRGAGAPRIAARIDEIMRTEVVRVREDETVDEVARKLLAADQRVVFVARNSDVLGLVTEIDVLRELARLEAASDRASEHTVADLMTESPERVLWGTTLDDAARICREKELHHLPVVEGDQLVGVISERDLLRAHGVGRPGQTTIDEYVSRNPQSVATGDSLESAAALMVFHSISSLPVLRAGDLVGIVTTTDLLRHLASDHSGR